MKKTFYFLSILAAFFVTHNLFAQLPENVKVSTGDNEYWYYIQNGADPTIVRSGANFIDNGSLGKAGFFITSQGGNGSNQVFGSVYYMIQNKELQLWKIVEDGNGSYYLINKKTENKLALGTGTTSCYGGDGANCNDLFYTNTDGNMAFNIKKIGNESDFATISRTGINTKLLAASGNDKKWSVYEAEIEDQYDLPEDSAIVKSEKAWVFVSEEEMAARPYPQLSTEGDNKWYTMDMISTSTNYNGRVLCIRVNPTSPSEYMISRAAKDVTNDAHLWKFIAVPGENAQLYIVNKLFPNQFLSFSDAGYSILADPKPFVIKDIRNGELGIMPIDPNWNQGGVNGISFTTAIKNLPIALGTANENQTSAYNFVSTFKFTPANNSTNISTINNNDNSFEVYTENGYIKVTGTDVPFVVYTISGQIVNAKSQLPKGVYIVRIGSASTKVMIF